MGGGCAWPRLVGGLKTRLIKTFRCLGDVRTDSTAALKTELALHRSVKPLATAHVREGVLMLDFSADLEELWAIHEVRKGSAKLLAFAILGANPCNYMKNIRYLYQN